MGSIDWLRIRACNGNRVSDTATVLLLTLTWGGSLVGSQSTLLASVAWWVGWGTDLDMGRQPGGQPEHLVGVCGPRQLVHTVQKHEQRLPAVQPVIKTSKTPYGR